MAFTETREGDERAAAVPSRGARGDALDGEVSSRPTASTPSRAAAPGEGSTVVLVSDADHARAHVVARVAADAGTCAMVVADAGQLDAAPGDVALVAVSAGEETPPAVLTTLRRLHEQQVVVIGYGDHAATWPLSRRAQWLLAGAARLLDSAASHFSRELAERLTDAARASACRRRDRHKLDDQMRACGLVGGSVAMRNVFAWVSRISAFSDFCVLLAGETGTGKDLLARAIHALDPRRSAGPFVAVNCAALAKTLSESELFGHRRGAFTGAERDRRGLVRAADGGVLFLDEIGELDLDIQGKLLHVLQDRRVLSVGEERDTTVDVRIVAATHRDLGRMVAEGRFREDLLHRLKVLSVDVPSLRQRPDDVGPLVSFFLEKYRALGGGRTLTAGAEFIEAVQSTELTGNVRQLENLVRRAVARKDDDAPLGLPDLPPELWKDLAAVSGVPKAGVPAEPAAAGNPIDASGFSLARALAKHERALVELAVDRARGNQSEVARLLGITPRSVYTKLRKHRLDTRHRP